MINHRLALRLILLGVPIVLAYFVYYFWLQTDIGLLQCSFYRDTSLLCPGCGGQRALIEIGQGNFIKALEYNALIYFYLAIMLYAYISLIELWVLKNTQFSTRFGLPWWFGYAFIVVLTLYFIVVNFDKLKDIVFY